MTKKYVIYFKLPFEQKTLCIYESGSGIVVEEGHKLFADQDVVCLNFDEYVQSISSDTNIPSHLFDINLAVRMLCGLPASRFNGDNAPWKGISCLGKHLSTCPYLSALRSIEKGKMGNYSDWFKELPEGWELLLIEALKQEHNRLVNELKAEGLLDQFLNVEMLLKSKFSMVGVQGIQIDQERLYSKYCSLDYEYFSAVKNLEVTHGFVVTKYNRKLSYEDIKGYIKDFTPKDFSKKYFWDSIEFMQETSEFLRSLLIEHRNRWDLSELLRISSSISDQCRIEYDVFGTVSGRILLNRPGIQYLKRTSRDIFSPQEEFAFVYADYAQFEPGILAWISGDPKLIDLYNKGDVYSGLAEEIGGECTRKIAKEIFLSFVYGMSRGNIRLRIVKNFGDKAGDITDAFFNQFDIVEKWKKYTIEQVRTNKFAKGPFAYIRRVTSEDTISDIERWAPNHIIQSTASGIFKNSLCEISSKIEECRMLVPMHDAILLECPKTQVDKVRRQVSEIMINCFQKTCPGINVRISFSPFALES